MLIRETVGYSALGKEVLQLRFLICGQPAWLTTPNRGLQGVLATFPQLLLPMPDGAVFDAKVLSDLWARERTGVQQALAFESSFFHLLPG